jgi:TatD DNase family protein
MVDGDDGERPMYFDSHLHFDGLDDAEDALERALAAGVDRMLAIGGGTEANAYALALAKRHPAAVRAAIGYDRDLADAPPPFEDILSLARGNPHIVAIGEIGLDYHYSPGTAAAQESLLDSMLAVARECRLPVVVHTRDADDATLAHLSAHASAWPADAGAIGVVHCFTRSWEFATRLLDLGFLIGLSGIVSFKNATDLRNVARRLPEDRLLIETDAPYLAPVPHRGRRNEPAFVTYVAEAIAAARGVPAVSIATATRRNANRLFRWPDASQEERPQQK